MIFEVDYKKAEYLAFFKSTLTNVYSHVKKASSLMCPLSKNLCLTTMVTKKLTPNRDCHVSPKNVGAGLQLLYRIVVGKENGANYFLERKNPKLEEKDCLLDLLFV